MYKFRLLPPAASFRPLPPAANHPPVVDCCPPLPPPITHLASRRLLPPVHLARCHPHAFSAITCLPHLLPATPQCAPTAACCHLLALSADCWLLPPIRPPCHLLPSICPLPLLPPACPLCCHQLALCAATCCHPLALLPPVASACPLCCLLLALSAACPLRCHLLAISAACQVCESKAKLLTTMLRKDEVPLRPSVDQVCGGRQAGCEEEG